MESNLNYGIIGNCQSAALIAKDGSIDWFCLPRFDSPSVFASLLDENKGGNWAIEVENLQTSTQYYDKNTCILITKYVSNSGVFEVHDFMPRYKTEDGSYYLPPDLIRYFKYVSGNPVFKVTYNPQLEYAQDETQSEIHEDFIKSHTVKGEYESIYVYSDMDLQSILERKRIVLTDDLFILLSYNQKLLKQDITRTYLKLQRTKAYWLTWSDKTAYYKKYNEQIQRSALTLKLLSYEKTGAILAAVTTSLPETIGEVRNWDYRFCWIRDASMVIKIMAKLGHLDMTKNYLNFIINLLPDKGKKMQIMYGINGESLLTETFLEHLSGYKDSKPVRIGNAAYIQKQNDTYGILMDVILQHFEIFSSTLALSEDLWTIVRGIIREVEENWHLPDKGIWEIRTEDRHFTFSKVLCWVAVDRAIKVAQILQRDSYVKLWTPLAETIKEDIFKNAWSNQVNAFTQSYFSNEIDASVLLMESYGFIDAKDARYVQTVDAIQKELEHEGLLYRYKNNDDFGKPKSAFTICSFWLINALYKIGRKKEARQRFSVLLSYANHLGLLSEDIDFETKRLLGNFPQAYSHLALIETAITLGEDELEDDNILLQQIHLR
ncbi:MAG: glycoside hydrolase family 15 protein [Bacteroidales bacterium]|nr:glycoside hydrolase family 15 protein [Bacteroidales bacterium]